MNQAVLFDDPTIPGGDTDLWQTPVSASDPILPILQARIGGRPFSIVDPGCGTGNLLAAAQKLSPAPELSIGVEIDGSLVSCAQLRFPPEVLLTHQDFTKPKSVYWQHLACENLPVFLGNPPYSKPRETIGLEFMERCIELAAHHRGIVCLLLPLDYAHGADRCDSVHANHRSGLYPLRTRPKCGNNKAGQRPLAWFLFDLGNPYSEWRPIG